MFNRLSKRIFSVFFLLALTALSGAAYAQTYGNGLIPSSSVTFVNRSANPRYVAFSVQSGNPGPVVWSSDCERFNNQIYLAPGQVCSASVPSSAGPSRFCARENPAPPGKSPSCFAAQAENLTIIGTNFTSGAGCNRSGDPLGVDVVQKSCVWYEISVVPESCTNCAWYGDNCKNGGGPSYNAPVQLSCAGAPTFTCRGPIGPLGAYGAKYPQNCGAPFNQPSCIGGLNGACLQAYFFPMSTSGACKYPTDKPQPNAQCPQGQTLFVTFLDGL